MSDSPEEDPPSFDSLLATPIRSSDGVVTVPSTISRRAAPGTNLKRRDDNEDLRLSNETFGEEEQKEVKRDGCTPKEPPQASSIDLDLSFLDQAAKTSRSTAAPPTMSDSLLQSFDPLIEGRRSVEKSATPAAPVPEASQAASTKGGRSSLSALFQAWNHLLLGQSAAPPPSTPLNLAGQLPTTQHPVFSPFLVHLKTGSKLTGAVASLLSPWTTGGTKDSDTSSLGDDDDDAAAATAATAGDPADDSLANLLHKINLKDIGEEDEEKEAFFSPDRGRASPPPTDSSAPLDRPVLPVDLPQSDFLEDTQTSILQQPLERSSHSLCSSHYSDAMESMENVTGLPSAVVSPLASPSRNVATTEEPCTPRLDLKGAPDADEEQSEPGTPPLETILPRRATLTPQGAGCPVVSVDSSSTRVSALPHGGGDDRRTTPSYHKENSSQRSPDRSPSSTLPLTTTSLPPHEQDIGKIASVEVQSALNFSAELASSYSAAATEYHFSSFTNLPPSPRACVQRTPPRYVPEAVVAFSPSASMREFTALETKFRQLDNSAWKGTSCEFDDGKSNVTDQPAASASSGDPSCYPQDTASSIHTERDIHALPHGSQEEPQFPSEEDGGLKAQPVPQLLVTPGDALPSALSSSLTEAVEEHEPVLRSMPDSVSATSVEAVIGETTSVLSVSHHSANGSASHNEEVEITVLENADVPSAATPPAGEAADAPSSVMTSSRADNGEVESVAATQNDEEAAGPEGQFEQVLEVTTEQIASPVHIKWPNTNRSVVASPPPGVTSSGETGLPSTSAVANDDADASAIEHSSAAVTETVNAAPTTQQLDGSDRVEISASTVSEGRSSEPPQRIRRATVTLENPLQLQRKHTPRSMEKTPTTTNTTEPRAQAVGRHSAGAKIVLEDKENVPPPKPLRRRAAGVRRSAKLADTSSDTPTYSPRQHSLTGAERTAPSTRPRRTQPVLTPEMMEKEKAQLREEIARLNALADSLRPVCANYQNTFEEALDLKCCSCMAFDSAATQAREELAATCSEAETVHKALEDSNRRFLKIKETIEERQKGLEVIKSKTEGLRSKLSAQTHKCEKLHKYCLEKLVKALEALNVEKQAAEREVNRLRVRAKQLDLKATSLEEEVQRVAEENRELTNICEKLIS